MKKIVLLLLLSFFSLTTQIYGQVAGSFNIITMKWRFDATTEQYLASNGFITLSKTLSHPYIFGDGDPNKANMTLVKWYIDRFFPDPAVSEYFMINWEVGPYLAMRDYPVTDPRFIAAEAEIIRLITEIKKLRPNLKVSMYNMPFRMWHTAKQLPSWNGVGDGEKFNKVLAKVDFIAPSLYTIFPDEEVGHERNVQYLKDNLNLALYYGKKFNKPVIPYVWHRVAWGTSAYQKQIIQKTVFAETLRFIATYSYNSYKPYAIYWYDGSGQFENYSGINNHLNGTVYNEATYYAMIRDYAKYVKSVLNTALGTTTTTTQKVLSYTLINADTDRDIQTITSGATLNLATLPSKNLNIRVNTNPATVGSLKLVLSGKLSKSVTENSAPYALFGGTSTNYNAWVPAVGSYTLTGTPYTETSGGGTAGTPLTVSFTVTNQTTAARFATADKENTLTNTTAIYPNPATTKLNIQLSEAGEGLSEITLNDLTGRVVLTKQVNNNQQSLNTNVDVQSLPKGVYILLVDTPKGRTSKRIVVQ